MASISDKKAQIMGSVAAVKTLLERYPVLLNISNDGSETSFGFMLNVLALIGVSEQEIIDWVAKLLAGKGTDGVLDGIEQAVKAILLLNIKKLFTCSMNPFIPDKLMYKTIGVNGKPIGGEGIEIDLDAVDTYGILNVCPINEEGSCFYFDAKTSDYNLDDANAAVGSENKNHSGYTVTELWKSRDFNAFLWYVINKGQSVGNESNKLYWDNRVKFLEQFSKDSALKERFFSTFKEKGSDERWTKIPIPNSSISKTQIIRCEYVERSGRAVGNNILKVYINPDRYYATRKLSYTTKDKKEHMVLWLNKTVFEFNYDYIYSLKLFNSKTLVASVINAILGLISTISINFSIKKEVSAQKVRTVVENIIRTDDNSPNGALDSYYDCFYSFSNKEYDAMLEEAIRKHSGVYTYNGVNYDIDYDAIFSAINEISIAATTEELQHAISNAITTAGNSVIGDLGSIDATSESTSAHYKPQLSFGLDIIQRLLNETVTQIVMQVLSPKVAILFKINSEIMGNADPQSDSWSMFMKDFQNLITELVIEIKNMILNQLFQWLMDEIKPLLELFVSRVMLETVRFYMELLSQLISACGFAFGLGSGNNYGSNDINIINLGDATGADIIPSGERTNNNGDRKKC